MLLIIAISLSMDAFSLSLAYGTLGLSKKDIIKLSLTVGVFHFIMPIFGMLIGAKISHLIPVKTTLIIFVILTFIGIQMILDSFKKKEVDSILTISKLLLFGFAVSLDSFSIGIGINALSDNYMLASTMFSIASFLFTYFGLNIGKKISDCSGKYATLLGGIALIFLGIICLIK